MNLQTRITRLEKSANIQGDIGPFIAMERASANLLQRLADRCEANHLSSSCKVPTEEEILTRARELHQKYRTIEAYNEAQRNVVFSPKLQEMIDRFKKRRSTTTADSRI